MVQWCKNDLQLISYRLDASTGDFDALSINIAMEPTDDEADTTPAEPEGTATETSDETPLPALKDLEYRSVTVSFTMPNYDPIPYTDSDGEPIDEGKRAYVKAVEDALENAVPSAFSDFMAANVCRTMEMYYQVNGFGMSGARPTFDDSKIPAPGESGSVSINCGYGVWQDMAFIFFPILENAEPWMYGMAYIGNSHATYEGLWDVIQSGGEVWRYLY
jgi:hypothetical protein